MCTSTTIILEILNKLFTQAFRDPNSCNDQIPSETGLNFNTKMFINCDESFSIWATDWQFADTFVELNDRESESCDQINPRIQARLTLESDCELGLHIRRSTYFNDGEQRAELSWKFSASCRFFRCFTSAHSIRWSGIRASWPRWRKSIMVWVSDSCIMMLSQNWTQLEIPWSFSLDGAIGYHDVSEVSDRSLQSVILKIRWIS